MKRWAIWKKYEHLFPHPNYIFTEKIKDQGIIKGRDIFVINKAALFRTLEIHKDRFIEKLGRSFSPEQFIKNIEEKKCLYPFINDDDELLGIILGFGRESSRLFVEAHEKTSRICSGEEDFHQICGVIFMGDPSSKEVKNLRELSKTARYTLQNVQKKECLLATLTLLMQETENTK